MTIGLDLGRNASGQTRYMIDSAAHLMNYEIYTTSARSIVWNTTNTVSYLSQSMATATLPVYGRIPGGQDVYTSLSYSDTITVTVNF